MEHIGVGDDDVTLRSHRLAGVSRGIPVEGTGANLQSAGLIELRYLRHLILRQGFGWKEIERLGFVAGRRVEHRQVVTQGLARRGRGHEDGMRAGPHQVPRPPLVGKQTRNAPRAEGFDESRREIFWEVGKPAGLGRLYQFSRDSVTVRRAEPIDELGNGIVSPRTRFYDQVRARIWGEIWDLIGARIWNGGRRGLDRGHCLFSLCSLSSV